MLVLRDVLGEIESWH